MTSRTWLLGVILSAATIIASPARAQSASGSTATATPASAKKDDPAVLVPAEPDVVVLNLPTTMRMPLFKGNFRLTHRFAGNLRSGTFGQSAADLFGLDQGAVIGFECRMTVAPNTQAAFYRSSFGKTIQFYGKYDAFRQQGRMPVSVSGLASVEGTNNFRQEYAPAVGVVIGRLFGTRVAAYVTPMWVDNSAAALKPVGARRSTTMVALGGRVRVADSTYLAAEVAIRAAGYAPDRSAYGFSIEKRVGGHIFSLTFTNTFGTTFAQVARGGAVNSLYLGFNLSRKFF